MALRDEPIEERADLPDGRGALVRVGLLDEYIKPDEQQTVAVELLVEGAVAASLNTVLDPDQEAEARKLADEIVSGLESGELAPTAAALEPLADELR